MNKKTISAIIAGFVATMGFSSLIDSTKADGQKDQAGMQQHHNSGMKRDGGWYSKKSHRGYKMHRRIEKFMIRYDTNGDDQISQEEIDTSRTNNLAKFDANKDGKLSLEEFQALWMANQHERMVRSFQRFDTDGDAEVTLNEYKQPLERFVKRHDRNGDGVVSREDRRRGGPHNKGYRHRFHQNHMNNMGKMDPEKKEL